MTTSLHGEPATLAAELEELLQFVYLMPAGVIKFGERGEVELLNPRAVQVLSAAGIPFNDAEQLLGALDGELLHDWQGSRDQTGEIGAPRRVVLGASGRDSDGLILQLRLVRPDKRCSMLLVEDVSELVAKDRELHRHEARLSAMMQHIYGYAVLTLDPQGRLAEWNPSISRQLGRTASIVGATLHEVLGADATEREGEQPAVPPFQAMQERVRQSGWCRFEAPTTHQDGSALWMDAVLTPMVEPDGEVAGYVLVARDITNERKRVEQLYQQAYTDPLTGLLNRRALTERARALLHRSPFESWCAVLLDIDHFKRVNDTWGHDTGDRVLQAVGQALKGAVRQGDVVGRLGGEEFVLLLDHVGEEEAAPMLERLREAIAQIEVPVPGGMIRVTASFGAAPAWFVDDWNAILRRADQAVYTAKAAGRNRVVIATGAGTP